ncbi:hypothetical protein Nepgr_015230 [Nepenthes gracilis]|uniref:AB hydrolase-1 domain-containing protein n=1 Tax=Nepenthes gracilis TaxID=150966 RepID=A0AAD3SME4_NEPGR|nr:hypothetical protein Nepgr_015230 [Nepenthes gracilis]
MVASCFSPTSVYECYLRRCFSAAGLSSQRTSIDNETTIHFWGPKPNRSSANKPSLLLIHGFGPVSLWQWHPQVHFLSSHFHLYVPDLIFFGDSTTDSFERSEIFQAKSISKLMDKLGVVRYSIIGTSYGGFVAYHMAAMWPERVDKVVVASSAINKTRHDNAELVKRAGVENIDDLLLPETTEQLRTLLRLVLFRRRVFLPDCLLNDILNNLYKKNKDRKSELLRGITFGRDGHHANITPLCQDVLLVWGDHDQIFPYEKAFGLKELLGAKTRMEVIKNTGHAPQLEKPKEFNNIVGKFLCG